MGVRSLEGLESFGLSSMDDIACLLKNLKGSMFRVWDRSEKDLPAEDYQRPRLDLAGSSILARTEPPEEVESEGVGPLRDLEQEFFSELPFGVFFIRRSTRDVVDDNTELMKELRFDEVFSINVGQIVRSFFLDALRGNVEEMLL